MVWDLTNNLIWEIDLLFASKKKPLQCFLNNKETDKELHGVIVFITLNN